MSTSHGDRGPRAVVAKVVKALDSSRSDLSRASGCTGSLLAARAIARNAAAAHRRMKTTMATVVAAMDAEFRTPLDVVNQAR